MGPFSIENEKPSSIRLASEDFTLNSFKIWYIENKMHGAIDITLH